MDKVKKQVVISEETWRQLKSVAARVGITVSDLAVRYIEAGLTADEVMPVPDN